MKAGALKTSLIGTLIAVAIAVGVTLIRRAGDEEQGRRPDPGEARTMPVETAPAQRGPMEQRRRFSGTLTPSSELRVAPKISGRIAEFTVDLADPVDRGQIVALLDDAEFTQAVNSARAEVAVAEARAAEADDRLELAQRERQRIRTLAERGVASDAALDEAESEYRMRQSAAAVANATLSARQAALSTAEIRLSYTRVSATWANGDDTRVVAERYLDEGDTVAANTPLLKVVRLRPIRTVFFVPERDYGMLAPGQDVELRTDAFPRETFHGQVSRVAPVFREDSRQARVEVRSENRDERLKPGMFVRAEVVLQTVEDTLTVPREAITRRGEEIGVFHVSEDQESVRWVVVETGIESGGRVQIHEPEFEGEVVVLGQQLLGDGSRIRIVNPENAAQ